MNLNSYRLFFVQKQLRPSKIKHLKNRLLSFTSTTKIFIFKITILLRLQKKVASFVVSSHNTNLNPKTNYCYYSCSEFSDWEMRRP